METSNILNKSGSDDFMSAFVNIPALQAKLTSLNSQIDDKQKQVADLKSKNQNLLASIANATGGDISINANKDIAIEAGTDSKTSYYHRSSSDFFGSTTTTKETQSQQVISALISGNNVNISSNQDVNVLASIITGGGDGNVSANNNLNINALQNMYYNYNFHQETQMDIGALALQITVAVALGAATGGVGFAALGVAGGFTAGATAGATAASKAVATQYGMSAVASGGKGGTEQIQSGDSDSTTTRSQTVITSSLLFDGNLTLGAGGNINTQTANIKANNVSQEVKQSSTTSQISTHTDIEPDYGSLVKDAAITGAIAGGTVVASKAISQYKADYLKAHPESAATVSSETPNLKIGNGKTPNTGVQNCPECFGSDQGNLRYAHDYGPGVRSASEYHDVFVDNMGIADIGWLNKGTIPPIFAINYFAAGGGVSAGMLSDIVTHSTSHSGNTTTKSVLISN